jgi:hypothetical protein
MTTITTTTMTTTITTTTSSMATTTTTTQKHCHLHPYGLTIYWAKHCHLHPYGLTIYWATVGKVLNGKYRNIVVKEQQTNNEDEHCKDIKSSSIASKWGKHICCHICKQHLSEIHATTSQWNPRNGVQYWEYRNYTDKAQLTMLSQSSATSANRIQIRLLQAKHKQKENSREISQRNESPTQSRQFRSKCHWADSDSLSIWKKHQRWTDWQAS